MAEIADPWILDLVTQQNIRFHIDILLILKKMSGFLIILPQDIKTAN